MQILPPDEPSPIVLTIRVDEDGAERDLSIAAMSPTAQSDVLEITGGRFLGIDDHVHLEDVDAQWPMDRVVLEQRFSSSSPHP